MARVDFDKELSELAELLRAGAQTARTIAMARKRDEETIIRLAAQADVMAGELDAIVDDDPQPAAAFLLRRDR